MGGGGVVKMFTLHYKPYRVKWFTKGEGGVKIIKKHVHVVCERPLTQCTVGSNTDSGSRNEHECILLFRYILDGQPKSTKTFSFLPNIYRSKIPKSYNNHEGENTKFEFPRLFLPINFFSTWIWVAQGCI